MVGEIWELHVVFLLVYSEDLVVNLIENYN